MITSEDFKRWSDMVYAHAGDIQRVEGKGEADAEEWFQMSRALEKIAKWGTFILPY